MWRFVYFLSSVSSGALLKRPWRFLLFCYSIKTNFWWNISKSEFFIPITLNEGNNLRVTLQVLFQNQMPFYHLLESLKFVEKVYLTTYYYLMLYRCRNWGNNEYVCGLWCRFRYRCTDDVISGYILSMTNWILLCMVPASFWQLNLQKTTL